MLFTHERDGLALRQRPSPSVYTEGPFRAFEVAEQCSESSLVNRIISGPTGRLFRYAPDLVLLQCLMTHPTSLRTKRNDHVSC